MQEDAGRWTALATLGLGVIMSLTTWFSATAILPELTASLSLSPALAPWLTNAVQLGFVVGALASAALSIADVWPMTRIMAVAAVLAALANAVLLLEPSAVTAIAARFMTGAALAGVYPPALKFIATWFVRGRGLAMGAMVGSLTLGSAMPHLFRAFGDGVDWQSVIVVSSLCSAAAAAVFLLLLREGPHKFARTRIDPRQLKQIVGSRPVMLANVGYFGHMWELYAMWGWILAYVTAAQTQGLNLFNVSVLAFAIIAMGAPGCVMAGWLADRIGRCRTTALMMIVSGGSALLIGVVFNGPTWIFVAVALVWGLTVVADSAQFSAAVSELVEQTLVGTALAFQIGVGFGITIFVIWIMPTFVDLLGGWQWAFAILAVGPLVGSLSMMILRADPRSAVMAGGLR